MKKLGIMLALIMAGILLLSLWRENRTERERIACYARMESELRPLNIKKRELQGRLEELNSAYEKPPEGKGSAIVLFTGPDASVYTDIYPVMKENGYTGVLAVSESRFPGKKGCMSRVQFMEMLTDGWGYCIIWQEEDEEGWLDSLIDRVKEAGLEPADAIYFPDGTYTDSYDEQLLDRGFAAAVHHGEENRPLVVFESGEGIWRPGAVGLMGEEPRYRLEDAVNNRGNIVFTVGFDTPDEQYDEESFRSMIGHFDTYRAGDALLVTDFEGARSNLEKLEEERDKREAQFRKDKAEIEGQLKRIQEEINGVYDGYLR